MHSAVRKSPSKKAVPTAMRNSRLLALLLIAALVGGYFLFDLDHYLSLGYFKDQQAALSDYVARQPLTATLGFLLIYILSTALSLPGAALLTLVAGALFGLVWGTLVVSFASTIGATLAFLATRFLFRDAVRERFAERLRAIDAGLERDGAFYLCTLRLVPVVPFFLVNLLMGLTPIRTGTFYWVSQLSMLPGTLVYVGAGRELGRIDSLSGIVSPGLLLAFALLAIFPWLARALVDALRAARVYRPWTRPRRFDRNLIVIGGGSAGLVSAYIAATVKAKVTLIEKHKLGGDCLNTGCVPSKALIRAAGLMAEVRRAPAFGINTGPAEVDFAALMARIESVIKAIEPHDSVDRYTALGVECLAGEARITSPWTVSVNGQSLSTRAIIIAAGAAPAIPPIAGLDSVPYLTSDTLWSLRELPRRMVVLGGGPIGCELAQCFARLGTAVTQIELLPQLLAREDPDVAALLQASLEADGVRVLTGHAAKAIEQRAGESCMVCSADGSEVVIPFDTLLVAVGRVPRVAGYGLEELGIAAPRTVETNAYLQTLYPNIYACGDVAGPFQYTHTAAHQAWYATVNALFGRFRRYPVDYSTIPSCTFTDPEVARVGLNEREAQLAGIAHEVTVYGLEDLDRAIAEGSAHGFVKVLTPPGKDRILGATMVGSHATELLAEFTLAMRHGLGLNRIMSTIHAYPTYAEAAKYAAGGWKRAHAPKALLAWVERYHAWERG